MLLMPVSFAVANRHVDIKMEWREGQKTSVDPEWLKVYVDDESKSLYLNFKDSFAPITVEVKDIEKQIFRISNYNISCCGRRVYSLFR